GTVEAHAPLLSLPVNKKVSFTLSGSGTASPMLGQEHAVVRLTLQVPKKKAQTVQVAERLLGSQLYLENAQHHWFVLNLTQLPPLLQATMSQEELLATAGQLTVADHGVCVLNGTP